MIFSRLFSCYCRFISLRTNRLLSNQVRCGGTVEYVGRIQGMFLPLYFIIVGGAEEHNNCSSLPH